MNMSLAPFDPNDLTNHVSFCRVAATLRPSGDSNIKIEVWLPLTAWNGKMMGVGNFGWAGSIMYGGLLLGLEHGYATVSTDTGHDNSLAQGAFALGHPDKMIDYGYRASHGMTVDAKLFIKAFYGESPKHEYWYGCSLGGQMGLTEIERFPEDYDGAIIGAPASPIVDLNAYQIWPSLLVAQKPSRELGRAKSAMLQVAVMNACDELDGAKDGEIEDPTACHFDPASLLCKGADNNQCLTAAQVEFVQMLYKGPVDSKTGQKIFEGAATGTEGMFGGYSANGSPMGVATALFKYMVFQDPDWDWKTLNMEKDVAFGRAVLRTINIADNPNLKPFFDLGGKVLWYHGWMDGASPLESVNYMKAVEKAVGAEQTQRSMRLFAIPGMGHCYEGSGCDAFDKLGEDVAFCAGRCCIGGRGIWGQVTEHPVLLALSKTDHTLSIVDPVTLKIIAKMPVGPDPHEVIASADGSRAWVSNMLNSQGHELDELDLVNHKALPSIDTTPMVGLHGLDFQGGKVWYTAQGAKSIGRLDPETSKTEWIMGTGQDFTHLIRVMPDGQTIFVSNAHSASVSIIENREMPLDPMRPGPGARRGGTGS